MSIDTLDKHRQSGLIEEIKMKDVEYKYSKNIDNSWKRLTDSKANESDN